jgi:hypothetical protein
MVDAAAAWGPGTRARPPIKPVKDGRTIAIWVALVIGAYLTLMGIGGLA